MLSTLACIFVGHFNVGYCHEVCLVESIVPPAQLVTNKMILFGFKTDIII